MIKVLSLFSGIGAFERAFCRIGLDWELVNYCEIDRYASMSYAMVNQCSESLNLHDVRTVTAETVRDNHVDLITYGFPCQDISIAGKQQGFVNNDGESTRSGLFFEALRVIKELQPRYAIAENVKALTNKKFQNEFNTVLSSLEDAGYNNYWSVLNAKDYGIPQNRERVFIVSIRRDVDDGNFQFPDKEPLTLRLCDMLEPTESVDEKYYLSTEREGVRRLIADLESRYSINSSTAICKDNMLLVAEPSILRYERTEYAKEIRTAYEAGEINERRCNLRQLSPRSDGISNTLTTVLKDNILLVPKIIKAGNIAKDPNREHIQDRIYDPSGLAPTLNTVGGGNLEPKITIIGQPKGGEKGRVVDRDGIGYTLTATEYKDPLKIAEQGTYGIRIRKLTPRECWRLMGFLDEEFDRVHGISNSQLYKQAGNSIVVNVLSALLTQLFNKTERD